MSEWHEIKGERDNPPAYKNVLFAFVDHWNQVVGFYCGKGSYYETSAHDHNSEIAKPGPRWWAEIPEVPHHPKFQAENRATIQSAGGGK